MTRVFNIHQFPNPWHRIKNRLEHCPAWASLPLLWAIHPKNTRARMRETTPLNSLNQGRPNTATPVHRDTAREKVVNSPTSNSVKQERQPHRPKPVNPFTATTHTFFGLKCTHKRRQTKECLGPLSILCFWMQILPDTPPPKNNNNNNNNNNK